MFSFSCGTLRVGAVLHVMCDYYYCVIYIPFSFALFGPFFPPFSFSLRNVSRAVSCMPHDCLTALSLWLCPAVFGGVWSVLSHGMSCLIFVNDERSMLLIPWAINLLGDFAVVVGSDFAKRVLYEVIKRGHGLLRLLLKVVCSVTNERLISEQGRQRANWLVAGSALSFIMMSAKCIVSE